VAVVVAVDVGSVRVGVAASDPSGILASPVATLRRDAKAGTDLQELAALVREREAGEVVVGNPVTLRGRAGTAAELAAAYAGRLAELIAPVPVRLVDERLTTVVGEQRLRASGVKGKDKRAVIDQAAAVALLQGFLDMKRAQG
jgi:putative Holliday junction resolvase